MESGNGKRAEEEAGPSSGLDGSKREMTEKPSDAFDDGRELEEEAEEEEEHGGIDDNKNGVFVPGPLLSLKEQIERDKVFFFFFIFTPSFCYVFFPNFFDVVICAVVGRLNFSGFFLWVVSVMGFVLLSLS